MKRSIMLVVLAAMAALHAADHSSDYTSLMTRGRSAMNAEDYGTARVVLEEAVALRPSDPVARYSLAIAYSRQKKYRLAVKQLEEVVRISPEHADALAELGSIGAELALFEQAERRYRQALQVDPNPRVKRGLAVTLVKQGRLAEASVLLEGMIRAEPSDVVALYQLGIVDMRRGDCIRAMERFRAVLRYQPRHTGALFNLGNCHSRMGRDDEAAPVLAMFMEAAGQDARRTDRRRQTLLLLQEADGLLRGRHIDDALRVVDKAIRINPDDFKPHAFRGQCLEAKGDIAGALESFTKAAKINPHDPVILVETGRLHGMSGHFRDAIPYLNRAADIDPLMAEPHLFLAAAYSQLGRSSDAARAQRTYRQLMTSSGRRP